MQKLKSIFKLPNGSYTVKLEEFFTQLEKNASIHFIDQPNTPFCGVRRKGELTVHRYTYRYITSTKQEKTLTVEEIELI